DWSGCINSCTNRVSVKYWLPGWSGSAWLFLWCFTCVFVLQVAVPSFTSSSDMSSETQASTNLGRGQTELGDNKVPFGVNEVRLSAGQWIVAVTIIACVMLCLPALWTRFETFVTGPDYRIPYELSKDYWLYARRLGRL